MATGICWLADDHRKGGSTAVGNDFALNFFNFHSLLG
jgi:hypothetical protein